MCVILHIFNMHHNYANMRLICVNMQPDFVSILVLVTFMYVNRRLKLCCMRQKNYMFHVDINKSLLNLLLCEKYFIYLV